MATASPTQPDPDWGQENTASRPLSDAGSAHGISGFAGVAPAAWPARWPAAAALVITLAILITGYGIQPDARGIGTHEQLGMAPCSFLDATGMPCATCGMTTSVSYLTHGHPLRSFLNQPMGFVFGLANAMLAVAAGWSLITGLRLGTLFQWLLLPLAWFILGACVLLAWGFKVWMHTAAG